MFWMWGMKEGSICGLTTWWRVMPLSEPGKTEEEVVVVENQEFCFGQEWEAYDTFKKMSSNQQDRRNGGFLDRSRLKLQIWISRAYKLEFKQWSQRSPGSGREVCRDLSHTQRSARQRRKNPWPKKVSVRLRKTQVPEALSSWMSPTHPSR